MLTSHNIKNYKKKPPNYIKKKEDCIWNFNATKGGYPAVAFEGERGGYVCPSMFRDLSDYAVSWPFEHFHEDVRTWDPDRVSAVLPPVRDLLYAYTCILYACTGSPIYKYIRYVCAVFPTYIDSR